jgi:hypothetical protein
MRLEAGEPLKRVARVFAVSAHTARHVPHPDEGLRARSSFWSSSSSAFCWAAAVSVEDPGKSS